MMTRTTTRDDDEPRDHSRCEGCNAEDAPHVGGLFDRWCDACWQQQTDELAAIAARDAT